MKIGLQSWGSEGDIQPFVALAGGLVRAGHQVTLVVTDNAGRDYGEAARRHGFALTAVPTPASTDDETLALWRRIIAVGNPIRQARLILRHGFDPIERDLLAAATDLCATHDAVVGHFFLHPLRIAAALLGTPVATLNIVHNCIPSAHIKPPGVPDLGAWAYPLVWRLSRALVNRVFLPRVNALRRANGLAPDRDVMRDTWAADRLNLVAVSPTICARPPDWDDRHVVCGFLRDADDAAPDPVSPTLEAFLAAGAPPLYFTFGSMMLDDARYVAEVAAAWHGAVSALGCRAVFQLPAHVPADLVRDARVHVVARAPYAAVFPRCALVVHHGGAGTTQSALRAGRPSVVVAHLADQSFWGSELERLGVAGPTLSRRGLSGARLARAIARALASPTTSPRAAALGRALAGEPGVDLAVAAIESRLVGRGRLA